MSLLINAYCTHRNPPSLGFPHHLHSRRDRTDPELLEHLNGFIGFILNRGERDMSQHLYHMVRHIERVQHHLSLEIEKSHYKTGDILDALDLHIRLNWAVRQAALEKRNLPANLDAGVISERHHALNWLVRFEDADWDEVDTPT